MAENEVIRESIPEFETLADIADFWDEHSTADYDDLSYEVQFDIQIAPQKKSINIIPELSERLISFAQLRGISLETLVNVWLTEKVFELAR